jgi:hypothetical protein
MTTSSAVERPTNLAWPTGRGTREEFAAVYGEERAHRFLEAFYAKDPVADALFESETPVRVVMKQLRDSLKAGAAVEEAVPEVRAFLEDMLGTLEGVDPSVIEKGRRVYLSISPFIHGSALGPGSLVHTYSSPAISTVLAGTGRFVDGAVRRLNDTVNWTYQLYLTDSLTPGGGGFEHTGLVRAMHAYARKQHLERVGGDTSEFGAPINEIDMLRTWLDFTYVPYQGLVRLGWETTPDQVREIYAFWRVVGRLLGIPADLLEGLNDHESSRETAEAIDSVSGKPDDNSRALVHALVDAMAERLAFVLKVPKQPMVEKTQAEVHILHGSELAESLDIPHTTAEVLLAMGAPVNKGLYELLRAVPPALEKTITDNEAMLKDILSQTLDGQSAYETAPVQGS